MSCYACTKQYGFFTKEVGCPSCGYSFCTKCLKKEIEVPKCGNIIKKVCLSCFEKLRKAKQLTEQTAESSTTAASTSTHREESQKTESVLDAPIPDAEQLPDIDETITNRLNAIKERNDIDRGSSDADIKERLANLKDVPNKEYNNLDILNKVDKRSDEDKTMDLIKQFLEESVLDTSVSNRGGDGDPEDPIKNIESRLAALKGTSVSGVNKVESSDSPEDEETAAQKIVNKFLEEAKLPDFDLTPEEKEFVDNVKPTRKDQEELPWCTICNEDAVVRCIGCDGDLFCSSCFKEIHAHDEEYREHSTKPYTANQRKHSNESN